MARILVLNPNSSRSMTAAMDRGLDDLRLQTGHQIQCLTNDAGPEGIETAAHVAQVVPDLIAQVRAHRADAYVVACFSDPGISALREVTPCPVLGIGEAAYLTAMVAGSRFGIISILEQAIERHRRRVADLGILARLGGDRSIDVGTAHLEGEKVYGRLLRVGTALRDQDGCDVVILGCAGLGGYRSRLQADLGTAVIDPVQAAVAQSSMVASLQLTRPANIGTMT